MFGGVDPRFAIEAARFDHQRVAFIAACGVAQPRWIRILRKLASVSGNHMEHVVRLEQDREAFGSLHNLYWICGLHGPRVTPWQAAGSVVESFARPLFTSP